MNHIASGLAAALDAHMGAFENFLKRRGYARLDRYGLILTPEGRVLSTRPAVLDDGLGNRIVGWLEGDLAAMELDHHGAPKKQDAPKPIALPKPPPAKPVAAKPVAPKPPAAKPVAPKPVAAAPAAPPAPRPLPGVAPIAVAPAPVPPAVAPGPQVDEDEWEWEIAMARARAAAEDVEEARVDLLGAQAVIASAVIKRKTTPGIAIPVPLKADGSPMPDPLPEWPQTEPYNERFDDKQTAEQPQVMTPLQKSLLVEKRTVIPVPQLPTVTDPRALRPVTKPAEPRPPRVAKASAAPTPRRYARGTARQEDTVKTQPVLAHEERTSPYIELPPEVKPSGFAHIKRVAAKQR